MYDQKIVIVKKKKVVAGGHHGGSWKVAYADFVTAMMAFFLVMWIMGMDQGVKDLVQGYFNNPVGFRRAFSGGLNPISAGNAVQNINIQRTIMMTREAQSERFRESASELEARLLEAGVDVGSQGDVEITVTNRGLRIDLMEAGGGTSFFARASAELQPRLVTILTSVAEQLTELPNPVIVEGHTDALPFRGRGGYTNWELSVDRANGARRALQAGGLPSARFAEVRGYAATQPKDPSDPLDPRNRRISILIPFTEERVEFTAADLERMLLDRTPDVAVAQPGTPARAGGGS